MSNPYFAFKQFTIHQDACAMKVCTDACLFGAWTAEKVLAVGAQPSNREDLLPRVDENAGRPHNRVEKDGLHPSSAICHILDIGSGTGLLALMLAQKLDGIIDTIEIDANAHRQAFQNVSESSWSERIRVIHADVKSHRFQTKYDLIISNPPFFESHLRSPIDVINVARHDVALKREDVIALAVENLAVAGHFSVLLPFGGSDRFISLARASGLYLHDVLYVKQTPGFPTFRSFLYFGSQPGVTSDEEIVISEGGRYSQRFISLLKDYYLYL